MLTYRLYYAFVDRDWPRAKALIEQLRLKGKSDTFDKKKLSSAQFKADYYVTHVVRKKEEDPVGFYQFAILSYSDIKQALE